MMRRFKTATDKDVFVLLTRQEKLKRIRDVNRLLTKKSDTLPEEIKKSLESTRDALQDALQHSRTSLPQRTPASTVKEKLETLNEKLKFFELKKVQRLLRQKRQELLRCLDGRRSSGPCHSAEEQALRADLDRLQNDLHYIQHFPKNRRYISVFLDSESQDLNTKELVLCQKRIRLRIRERLQSNQEALKTSSKQGAIFDKEIFSLKPADHAHQPKLHGFLGQSLLNVDRGGKCNQNAQSSHIMFDEEE